MAIRYAGIYSGPSYGSYDPRDGFEGFASIGQAKDRYSERQETSGAWPLPVLNLTVNADWAIDGMTEIRSVFPATTPQDTLELYRVQGDVIDSEPFARFTAGPRGGAIRQNY
jgi:hypothetical protein